MVAKVLVAAVPTTQALVERFLAGCPLDFVSAFEDGERRLAENRYSDVLVGHLFAESRMFEFATMVRARQPWARVICVKGAGPPLDARQRAAIDLSVRQLGSECFIDLTAEDIPDKHLSVFDDLLKACRENPQPL
jgi:hypothetical protein